MLRKNTASQNLSFVLVNASTGAAVTGATVTARRSIDGAAQASCTGSVSELGNGQYNIALSQADTNGNEIGYLFTATSAMPVHITALTTAADPSDSVRLGLTALPNAAAGANGGLPTGDASGRVLLQATQTGVTIPTVTTLTNYTAPDNTSISAIKLQTDLIPASPAATGDIPTTAQIADKVLGRSIAGGADGGRTVSDALRVSRNKVVRSGSTLTVYAEDDTTVAWTATITTSGSVDPVIGVDPA